MKALIALAFSLLVVLACPGRAEAATSMRPASLATDHQATEQVIHVDPSSAAFAVAPVSDDELAGSYGAGTSRVGREVSLAAVHGGLSDHVGVNTRVALDVWLTEVADPLILANIARTTPFR